MMLELLAAIQSVEPVQWPLLAVFLFSASLYPLGLFMPCSTCCERPCDFCEEDTQFGQTVTVTLSNMPDQGRGQNLCVLAFDSNFGSGAAGYVNAPGGVAGTDDGPITDVVLTDNGSGYAVLGRVAPTLTITGGSGSGATFTPTLASTTDGNGFEFWSLESVAITGGSGYLDGDVLTITEAVGDVLVEAAAATIRDKRVEPTLTISGNATETVSVTPTGNYSWQVDTVTVSNGGSGYTEGGSITFSADGNDTTVTNATGTARVVHDEPENAVITITTAGGSGAVLVPVWELLPESQWPAPHKKLYRLTSMTVSNGGSGYQDYDLIDITFSSAADGTVTESAYIDADIVGGSGEIQQVYIADLGDINTPAAAGRYIGSQTDALHSVVVTNVGEYYEAVAGQLDVFVSDGGSYYREDASEPPYVATVTVNINQTSPSNGSGAVLAAVIDQNTASGTFGQITSITITNAGTDYLAWQYINNLCCAAQYNRTFVLNRHPTDSCRWDHYFCGPGTIYSNLGRITVTLSSQGLVVSLVHEQTSTEDPGEDRCTTGWLKQGPIDCSTPHEMTTASGRTAIVSAGGTYNPFLLNPQGTQDYVFQRSCHACCRGTSESPAEISVSLTNEPWYAPGDTPPLADGTYVLSAVASGGNAAWAYVDSNLNSIGVSVFPDLQTFAPLAEGAGLSCFDGCVITAGVIASSPTNSVFDWSNSATCGNVSGTTCAPSGSCTISAQVFFPAEYSLTIS